MTRKTILTVLVAVMVVSGGCVGRLAREGLGEVKGASGKAMVIEPPSAKANPNELAAYRCFRLGEISNDVGGQLPGNFMSLLGEEVRKHIADKKLPNDAGAQTLLIRGRIIHYENSGMMGNVFGPLEEVICRTEFVDASSGRVLAVANCVGRTNTTLNAGVKTKAEGLAKAFVGWIDDRYPKSGRSE